MMWRSWKNVCWASGGWTTPSSWQWRLNACVRVNGGHFEHTFWASDFLLCFVCFIDTGSPKCDRYKHVQSANIVWNVLLLCLRFHNERVAGNSYASDFGILLWSCVRKIMKIRHDLLKFLAFSYEVVHEKLWKSVTICKSYGEEISGTFLCGHGGYF